MMAHGEADLGPALTPTEQHKLDTWDGLVEALEGLFAAKVDIWRHNHREMPCAACIAIEQADAALKAARA